MFKLKVVPKLSANRRGGRWSGENGKAKPEDFIRDIPSLVRGLYSRVARQYGVDSSYVTRVARGERRSRKIEDALERELRSIAHIFRK